MFSQRFLSVRTALVSDGLEIRLPLSRAFPEASVVYSAGSFPAELGYRLKIAFVDLAPVNFVPLRDAMPPIPLLAKQQAPFPTAFSHVPSAPVPPEPLVVVASLRVVALVHFDIAALRP